ncbi:MAG TPA: hypothetical protein VHC70_13035, partial [Phycisphaerales bacterium]|nr:hypothetical protein [Phycisphaerales bacterium]
MPTPAEPPKPVICPECGTPDIEPSRATITRHRLVALVPRTTIALLLLAAIAWAWFSRVSFPFSSGGTSSDVDLARVAVTTWGTLRSAAGGHSDGFLTRAARCALVR